ncbi:xanthine dehydrogenase family protein molybdopterin-binding subunit [Geodermatophilus sabuli]|uniref:Xanthine dehydrogenase, molybdenum binding subunit apoprotein n=1 Tax=Geodermatophilus sabuli TaxID=1564158 RepID=A0A285E855_9ACTN|nr:xanthine dehydrogenase family protein molybdopterin-binding subunit [Geodermatophilus sabuli]MBB3082874.1 xanthine dehydrogenase YagR molybdenum-binding subunit [Geodermatophilus sabuli]SNX94261.1 xanthine dehydrogenase, molybdenum binding subunit apoprotein [Geodermatophilus sabuli]
MTTVDRVVGAGIDRIDGPAKVRGTAPYAYEHDPGEPIAHVALVQSTVNRGRITQLDPTRAEAMAGVLAVLTPANAPRLSGDLASDLPVLQSLDVHYQGQVVAVVVAETSEVAKAAVGEVSVEYAAEPPDVRLAVDRPDLYAPEKIMAGYETDSVIGDVDGALAAAAVTVDATYETPTQHNNPIEMHTSMARWDGDQLTMWDANQGPHNIVNDLVAGFALDGGHQVRIISPYVGGAFGSKAFTHPNQMVAAMAARVVGRTVVLELTRQQMFSLVGHRTPTIQRVRLGADPEGRLSAISHEVVEHTSRVNEFAEQTATPTRVLYAAPNRRTTHRLARLDVPPPTIMRAPGETPGMFALESAMDELAHELGIDPVELRIRNEPTEDPERHIPWSSRSLVQCLRTGAERFGWAGRDLRPGVRTDGRWLVGTGVAAATYPARRRKADCRISVAGTPAGPARYVVEIDGSDIGTGAWTALTQIAADALGVGMGDVELRIGDSRLPFAGGAGGSTGLASWGSAIVLTARELRRRLEDEYGGQVPPDGVTVDGGVPGPSPHAQERSMHSFGAHFVEVRVDADTGEVRVPRATSVYAAGTIVNAKTARSQFLGGFCMGLSMALHEESVQDEVHGHYANHDLAEYHVATNADIGEIDIAWLDEDDPYVNELGLKGIGEIGITGAAAAVANGYWHATCKRIRDLPITPDKYFR